MLVPAHIQLQQVAFEQAATLQALRQVLVDLAMDGFIALDALLIDDKLFVAWLHFFVAIGSDDLVDFLWLGLGEEGEDVLVGLGHVQGLLFSEGLNHVLEIEKQVVLGLLDVRSK